MRSRRGTFDICVVAFVPILDGILLLHSSATANATSVAALIYGSYETGTTMGWPGIVGWLPMIMILASCIAIIGALCRLGRVRFVLFVPLFIVLGIMAIGSAVAAAEGSYLDGTIKPWEHILADQWPIITLFFIYWRGIFARSRDRE